MIAEAYSERRFVRREDCRRPGVSAVWLTNAAGSVQHFSAIAESPSRLRPASSCSGAERSCAWRLLP